MDNWAKQYPWELLKKYVKLKGNTDNDYACSYIEGILFNKGYLIRKRNNINMYSLIKLTMASKDDLNSMDDKRLMNLYQTILNHTREKGDHNRSLYLTLLEKVATILKQRNYRITVDKDRVATFELNDEGLKNLRESSNQWKDAPKLMLNTMGIYHQLVELIEKERIKKNNTNSNMKNILIRVDNPTLVNYVVNEIRQKLDLPKRQITIRLVEHLKFYVIRLTSGDLQVIADANRIQALEGEKEYTITRAANADTIISEVIKEYNRVECKEFHIPGTFGARGFTVTVYPTHINFAGYKLTHNDITALWAASNTQVGYLKVGGVDSILLTHANSNEKLYITREQLNKIREASRFYDPY